MILTLEIGGSEAEAMGSRRRKVFNATGGTIGRAPDCDWALADQFISSRHAVVKYQNGVFFIEDADSKNGVFVNSLDNRLAKGQRHELRSGDLILIDPYEITASIAEGPIARVKGEPSPAYPVMAEDPFAPAVHRPAPAARSMDVDNVPGFAIDPNEDVDPLAWLPGPKRAPDKDVRRASDLRGKPLVSEHYAPPKPIYVEPERVEATGSLIPDNWLEDPAEAPPPARGDSRPLPPRPKGAIEGHHPPAQPRPAAPKSVARAAQEPGDLKAVLDGAGLENAAVTPELARDFGEILRIVVAGLIDVLKAREEVKNAFGIPHTMFKPAENNPLKHSVNVEDALHNLLVKRNAAFLGPVDAFDDAFAEVRHHQVAMLAGFRAAFYAMLAEFDPDRLQAEFDKQRKKGSLIQSPAKLRYWDLYCEKIRDMANDPDTTFREIFGEEFAQTYEDQLRELKARGGAMKRQQRT